MPANGHLYTPAALTPPQPIAEDIRLSIGTNVNVE
jgi:hypothetical protein